MTVEYSEDRKAAYFDGYKFRLDVKTGYYLSTKPTDIGRRERLHCYVWRYYNGPIKDGYHVHHADADKSHNDIGNLRCIPATVHVKYHGCERAALEYEALCKNLNENARPKASEWHRSPEGREWHRKNCKFQYTVVEMTCEYCGEKYKTVYHGSNRFCSNNCKAAARRKSGVDDETRICAICGKEFRANRYASKACCSSNCTYKLRWNKRNQADREVAGL